MLCFLQTPVLRSALFPYYRRNFNKTLQLLWICYALAASQAKLLSATSFQKQPSRGALRKRCSENMQQIYRRTPMRKCDFNKVAKQIAEYFQNTFSQEHPWTAAFIFIFSLKFTNDLATLFPKSIPLKLCNSNSVFWKFQKVFISSKSFMTWDTVRSSHGRCSVKKGFHKNFAKFTEKHQCWCLFSKKWKVRHRSSEFCEIFKKIFFY